MAVLKRQRKIRGKTNGFFDLPEAGNRYRAAALPAGCVNAALNRFSTVFSKFHGNTSLDDYETIVLIHRLWRKKKPACKPAYVNSYFRPFRKGIRHRSTRIPTIPMMMPNRKAYTNSLHIIRCPSCCRQALLSSNHRMRYILAS